MAYKYQLGEARLSGSLIQEGSITAESSGDLTVAGSSDLNGTLDVAGQVDLAASGVSTNIRGGLTVDEDSLFSSLLQVDGTLDCGSTAEFQGEVTFSAAHKINVTAITANYTVASDVHFLAADSSSNTIAITLPSASSNDGRIIKIKDVGGNAGNNNITITRAGSDTIDGSASIVLESPYSAVMLVCNGSHWFIL